LRAVEIGIVPVLRYDRVGSNRVGVAKKVFTVDRVVLVRVIVNLYDLVVGMAKAVLCQEIIYRLAGAIQEHALGRVTTYRRADCAGGHRHAHWIRRNAVVLQVFDGIRKAVGRISS